MAEPTQATATEPEPSTRPYRFSTPVKVRFNETDLQGHVNFGHYLFYFDLALTDFFEVLGYDYPSMMEDGVDMLFVEAHSNYKSPARWPEVLEVKVRVGEIGRRSVRYEFEITSKTDDRVIATGHIVTVMVKKETWEPCPVPDRLRQAIAAFENGE